MSILNRSSRDIQVIINRYLFDYHYGCVIRQYKHLWLNKKPIKNKNAYIVFCIEERDKVVVDNPDMSVKQVITELGKRWYELKSKEKYEEIAAVDKARYDREWNAFTTLASWSDVDRCFIYCGDMEANWRKLRKGHRLNAIYRFGVLGGGVCGTLPLKY